MNSEKLGTLAEKLEFANALLRQKDREVKAMKVQNGKDAAFISELQAHIDKMQADAKAAQMRINDLTASLKNMASMKKKTPEEKAQASLDKCRADLKRCQQSRNELLGQLNKLNGA